MEKYPGTNYYEESTYADFYSGGFCSKLKTEIAGVKSPNVGKNREIKAEWTSPSDMLIGKVDLMPPLTSKVTRGIVHTGIQSIGDNILAEERNQFLNHLKLFQFDNNATWLQIKEDDLKIIAKSIKKVYADIYAKKQNAMQKEVGIFFNQSLKDLEKHLITELSFVLTNTYAHMIKDCNEQIDRKLKDQKSKLERGLIQKYNTQRTKIKTYYNILLYNQLNRNENIIQKTIKNRNDSINALYRHLQAQNITSTMYILSDERKKCKIKKVILDNCHALEILEELQKLKEKQENIDILSKEEQSVIYSNKQWKLKAQQILEVFLKFTSFSLKLLPEQSTFLLDLQKMVVLQLNEIEKFGETASTVLVNEDGFKFSFMYEETDDAHSLCGKPFAVEADMSEIPLNRYGSTDELPVDVDLPTFRLQRQFLYAKCDKFEDIKEKLQVLQTISKNCTKLQSSNENVENHKCNCQRPICGEQIPSVKFIEHLSQDISDISLESFLAAEVSIQKNCPEKKCHHPDEKYLFPNLTAYMNFNEENFKTVKSEIVTKSTPAMPKATFVSGCKIAHLGVPFEKTKDRNCNVSTQYSSQEDLYVPEDRCDCFEMKSISHENLNEHSNTLLNSILMRRRESLRRLLDENPNLRKIFDDECFDE